ncbi:MAG: HAMP domain-containing sensor histidine kinase [Bacteroidota bacterium]
MSNVDLTLTSKVLQVGELQKHILTSSLKNQKQSISKAIHAGIHDVRSPLCVIKPYINFLKRIDDQAKRNAILDKMDTSVQRIEKIISGLVEYTDLILLESPPPQSFLFEDAFKNTQIQLLELIKANDAQIKIDFSRASSICYPKIYLEKILFHTLDNAIKYQHPDRLPHVKVSTELKEEKVLLTIEDNGIGIQPEELEMLDVPFTKNKKDSTSVGLGLAKIKAMVGKNGGCYHIHSVPNKGTTIEIFLVSY